jgi:hypothetical protein
LIAGCKKPEDKIGLDVQPGEDALGVNKIDTLSMITYTIQSDSIRTDEFSQSVLGSYNDLKMGKMEASVMFHLRTASQNITFIPDSITIDSVVLSMRYSGFYGNFNSQTFGVYRLTEIISPDSSYYNNHVPQYDVSKNLVIPGFETVVPEPYKLITVGSDTAAPPQLRLKLLNELGDSIINASAANLASADAFVQFFKGLVVVPNNGMQARGEGGMLYLNLLDNATGLTIYYKEKTVSGEITTSIRFPITTRSARVTTSVRDVSGTELANHLTDTTLGMTRYMMQAMGGAKPVIYFPYLESLRGLPIVVNKAELILPIEYYTASNFMPAERVFLTRKNDAGNEVLIPDLLEPDPHADGFYSDATKQYRFLITRYVQQVLYGSIDHSGGLRIVPINAPSTASRVFFNGPNTTNKKKPQLIIYYTTY